ncbi:hypothetical protein CYMTET_53026, partial [Cymbomonas tetramitiformis]
MELFQDMFGRQAGGKSTDPLLTQLQKVLASPTKKYRSDLVDILREIYASILSCTNTETTFDVETLRNIAYSLVTGKDFLPRARVLASHLLRETSTGQLHSLFTDRSGGSFAIYQSTRLPFFLSLLPTLGTREVLAANLPQLIEWLGAESNPPEMLLLSLATIIHIAGRHQDLLKDTASWGDPLESLFCRC